MLERILVSFFILCLPCLLTAGQIAEAEVLTLTPEELANYTFETEQEDPAVVTALNVGQQYILSSQRQLVMDLLARRLGILSLSQSETDLKALQSLVDQKSIAKSDIRSWQAIGVIFGDILVKQHRLKWVFYEDEDGSSKALQWKETANFVFPITLFSRRVQFKQDIVMKDHNIQGVKINTDKIYQNGDKIAATNMLKNLIFSNDPVYSTLSFFLILNQNLISDNQELSVLFDHLLENNKFENEVRNLLIYKKSLFNSNLTNESELLEEVKPLLNSETLWRPHALLLLGDYFVSKGEYLKAKEFYIRILSISNLQKDLYDQARSQLALIVND